VADALSYTAVLVTLWMMRPSELRPSPVTPRAKGQVRAGLRYARSVPELWVPLVMMAVVGTLSYNFQVTLLAFSRHDLAGTASTFTLLYATLSIGSLVGALATARRETITVRVVALSAFAFGVAMALLTFAPSQAFAFPVGLLVGVASMTFMTSSTAIVQLKADPEMRGRVLALQAVVFLGSTPIGAPVVGYVCQHFGARYGLAIGAVAALGAGAWGLSTVKAASARKAAWNPITLR
jgi:predicted MFS family arabinose efflux permease